MKELPSEEEEIPFRIKTYKKKELACMYSSRSKYIQLHNFYLSIAVYQPRHL